MTPITEAPVLEGRWVRLEPLSQKHLPALEKVAFGEKIWRYMLTTVQNRQQLESWLESALQERANRQIPWVTVLKEENRIVGSTRFIDLDPHHRTVEIGHTWISPQAHGSRVNPEAKLLQLRFAFEDLGLNRVAFKTHHENLQSQAAIRKLGAVYEGTDGSLRHSVWFSITREDWPQVRSRLEERLQATQPSV
ncbi:GNAT family N-acetyltransferase [Edaphobacter albus]|uniref:GNAT family N-acetyltransferase n=1 Tax=Edaphobacter sp. 4G125 TaxID=2763071 RepID=UPI0016486DBE|nr:GNAT family N-acetyltransferase [Edaphobacter sp. 4G125]QNI35506.1 GNAT family N-acetyltransferase [Edaphobacter sp. 4G125]